MIIELSVAVAAVAFAVLVAYLVTTLMQMRRTAAQAEQLLGRLSTELPPLLQEVRQVTVQLTALTEQAREGVEHASVFLHAVGDVGDTVQQVHGLMRLKSGSLMGNLAGVIAGIRAATAVVKDRLRKEGGEPNGQR